MAKVKREKWGEKLMPNPEARIIQPNLFVTEKTVSPTM
jgi:hypothetical protein